MSYANSIAALRAKFTEMMTTAYTIYSGYGLTSDEFLEKFPSDDKVIFISHDGLQPAFQYEDLTQDGVKENISVYIKIPKVSGTTEDYNLNELNRVILLLMNCPLYTDEILGDRIYTVDSIIPIKTDVQVIHVINISII